MGSCIGGAHMLSWALRSEVFEYFHYMLGSKVLLGAPQLAIAPRTDVSTHLETLSGHRVEEGTVVYML